MTRILAFSACVLWSLAQAAPLPADEGCTEKACILDRAGGLLAAGDAEGALGLLKDAVGRSPLDGDLVVALGAAYLKAGNAFWAIRTLSQRVADAPDDCAARAWLAWAYLGQAGLDAAMEASELPQCPPPDRARLAMVRALVAGARGDRDRAVAAIREARASAQMWPSDRLAFTRVTRTALPDSLPELAWRLEVGAGYTSNALLGSPTDPASGSVLEGRTALSQGDLWLRFAPWVHTWVRPALEIQAKATGFLADSVRGLSWFDLTGRLGVSVGKVLPRVLLAWRPEWLLLSQGDRYDEGPVWYFAAHRAEVEFEAAPWLVVFAGAGHRQFRETARTRFEADLGLGGRAGLAPPLTLLWAFTGRVYRANASAWNLWGASALLSLQGRLPHGLLAKAGLSGSVDAYPDSAGYGPWGGNPDSRRDVLLKPGLSIWSPSWAGVRVGVQYDFSWRDSTLAAYDFEDHRATVRLVWTGDAEVLVPGPGTGKPILDLPWGGGGVDEGMERIQDLLRQDEQVQRSSSCVQ